MRRHKAFDVSVLDQLKFETDTISNKTFTLVVEKQDPADFAKKWVADNGAKVDDWLK